MGDSAALTSSSSRSLQRKDSQSPVLNSHHPIQDTSRRGRRFVCVFFALCVSVFISALEITVVSVALPTIAQDLQGENFVWVGSAYALAATALLPASGAFSELFGRRPGVFFSLGLFALGSALCGSAKNMSWLIAARTIQGAGGGGIQSVTSIIISDLIPLSERPLYIAILGLTWGIATAIGPLVGGAICQHGHWRWMFYMNLPICAFSAVLVFAFLNLRTPSGTFKEKMSRMDWTGNAIVVASSTSIVIALSWGGVQYAWRSANVLVPLILGLLGIAFWLVYEAKWATHPIVPYRLLSNRTSLSGYIQTFINPIPVFAASYYITSYYQACKGASPLRAGVLYLPVTLVLTPALVGTGLSIKKTQIYRPQLITGWSLAVIAMGTLSTVRADSPLSHPVGFSTLVTLGAGMLYQGTWFPVLAPLDVKDNAYALSFFAYCRMFAGVWGVTIGGAILQNGLKHKLPAAFVSELPSGVALAFASIPLIDGLEEPLREEVRTAFGDSYAVIWQVMAGITGIGLISSLFMKGLPLHTQVDERWGLEGEGKEPAANVELKDVPRALVDEV